MDFVRDVLEVVSRALVIVTCLVVLVFAYKAYSVYSAVQSGFGGGPAQEECWDPGGGEVCAPGGEDGLPGE